MKTDSNIKNMDNQLTQAAYRIASKTFTNRNLKNYYLYAILKKQIEDYGIKNIDELIRNFKKDCSNRKYCSEIDQLYKRDKELAKQDTVKVYKTINNITLDALIFSPKGLKPGDKRPAIVFFHGGGWAYGKPEWCMGLCSYFSAKGIIVISAQYRLTDRHGITPIECIADAKSIIRWVRKNAIELGIDPERIVAAGMSSGGHLAACTAILEGFDESDEDFSISSVPNALMLYSAVVNSKIKPLFNLMIKDRADPKDCSPFHNIRPGLPPTVIFHGTTDNAAPYWTVEALERKMKQAGNRCELHSFSGDHFFLSDERYYKEVMKRTEQFLASLGYLED